VIPAKTRKARHIPGWRASLVKHAVTGPVVESVITLPRRTPSLRWPCNLACRCAALGRQTSGRQLDQSGPSHPARVRPSSMMGQRHVRSRPTPPRLADPEGGSGRETSLFRRPRLVRRGASLHELAATPADVIVRRSHHHRSVGCSILPWTNVLPRTAVFSDRRTCVVFLLPFGWVRDLEVPLICHEPGFASRSRSVISSKVSSSV